MTIQAIRSRCVHKARSVPLGRLRGHVHRFEGVPVVVTYPLRNLLNTPQHKAKAWDDLCLALAQLSGSGTP